MRQGLIAVVLVAAAFAGGAAINGPMPAWARALIPGPGPARAPVGVIPRAPDEPESPSTEIPAAAPPALVLNAPRLEPAPPARAARPSRADADPASAPAPAPESGPEPPPEPKPPKADPAVVPAGGDRPAGDWADLRRRMTARGVSRYWIEGEPGGPSHVRCVIPTAGGRAVGQHFEADGADDLQAAEAALRRIDLWKATEQP